MKQLIQALSVSALLATAALAADECRDPKLRDEIMNMMAEDQKARPGGLAHVQTPVELAERDRVDAIHAKRVREIVKDVGWPGISLVGTNAARGMWLLVQHFELADQDQYLPLIEKAVARKEAFPQDFAYLLDRVRLMHGQKQVYGTQYITLKEGECIRAPLEDPDHVDERRKSIGLPTMLEYEKGNPNVKVLPNPENATNGAHPLRPETNQPPATAASMSPPAASLASLNEFDSLAIQGDVKAGLAVIARIPADSLSTEEQKRRECILSRFRDMQLPQIQVDGPLTRDVAEIYLKYWRRCLLREVEVATANAELFDNLKACLNQRGKEPGRFASLNDLTEALGAMLQAEGVHSIRGVTAPYYELMLWKAEDARRYTVELPESSQQVNVVLMSGFVLKGWLGFATCDKAHSGGWSTKDTLYCVQDSYDLNSEDFRVSYLAHEGQHFADLLRFPKLEQPELEYRAKLVELARAEDSLYSLLEAFTRQSGTNRESPHAFADLRVVQHLSKALFGDDSASRNPTLWSGKSRGQIHQAALGLLRKSTETLQAAGPERVGRYL
jgi:hypothetical protein